MGVPIIRTIVYWGLYWGTLILGNYYLKVHCLSSHLVVLRAWAARFREAPKGVLGNLCGAFGSTREGFGNWGVTRYLPSLNHLLKELAVQDSRLRVSGLGPQKPKTLGCLRLFFHRSGSTQQRHLRPTWTSSVPVAYTTEGFLCGLSRGAR